MVSSQAWWYTTIIPALGRLKFEASLGLASLIYIGKPCLKKKKSMQRQITITQITIAQITIM
jgi:hypothetical protein